MGARREHVDMVRHHYVRMNGNLVALACVPQASSEEQAVAIAAKDGLPIVPPHRDVRRQLWNEETSGSGHVDINVRWVDAMTLVWAPGPALDSGT